MVVVTGRHRKSAIGRLARFLSFGAVLALLGFGAGFVVFVQRLDHKPVRPDRPSDGIVVLTGGADRIIDAMELLADGYARRLLITGVNKTTTRRQLRRQVRRFGAAFDCCVDLGREARDTAGNAREAAAWARRHGFRSVILVTSSFHVPRSRVELRHAAPDLRIHPYAVAAGRIHIERWWAYPGTFRLLMSEFTKWIEAMIRTSGTPGGRDEAEN